MEKKTSSNLEYSFINCSLQFGVYNITPLHSGMMVIHKHLNMTSYAKFIF